MITKKKLLFFIAIVFALMLGAQVVLADSRSLVLTPSSQSCYSGNFKFIDHMGSTCIGYTATNSFGFPVVINSPAYTIGLLLAALAIDLIPFIILTIIFLKFYRK